MSTLKVNSIKSPSSSTGGIEIDSSGVVTGALPHPNRNLLYNGAMQVAQRGTSATGLSSGSNYLADRWALAVNGLGTWTESVESDAPSGSGFRKSLKVLCTTADVSPASTDLALVHQVWEGQDLQRIAKGTAEAKSLTLSFWVKSNVTGTYIARFSDDDNARSIAAEYTISASNTWEYKTISYAGDTSGVLDNDTSNSLRIQFWIAAGSNYNSGTLATSWESTVNANLAVGQTNLAAAVNNYWQITGVQLEVGDTATEFEHLPFGVELARCQRYYYRYNAFGTSSFFGYGHVQTTTLALALIKFPVTMRTAPTALEQSGTAGDYRISRIDTSTTCNAVPVFSSTSTPEVAVIQLSVASGLTAGQAVAAQSVNTNAYLAWSAEL